MIITPRIAVFVASFLAIILLGSMTVAAFKGNTRPATSIHDCALVQTRDGLECR